ncbi:hypothetical protein FACS1894125_5590 [Actinomycetota bacterium]|nr:hypothetical protein FACS1894125_5590 [Actinomycetota bacterium]
MYTFISLWNATPDKTITKPRTSVTGGIILLKRFTRTKNKASAFRFPETEALRRPAIDLYAKNPPITKNISTPTNPAGNFVGQKW